MQDYSFFPNVYQASADSTDTMNAIGSFTSDTVGRFVLFGGGGDSYAVWYRYVTASDEPFMYVVREKATGKILHCWVSDDPPPGYWGLSETPQNFEPPVIGYGKDGKPEFDPGKHEEIVSWKVKKDLWLSIKDRQKADRKKNLHAVIEDSFEYDKDAGLWKLKNLITN
jgi:hypothetical protein